MKINTVWLDKCFKAAEMLYGVFPFGVLERLYGGKLDRDSYCLMANHFHLQMETREEKLSTIMERLLKAYAITFNRKYR